MNEAIGDYADLQLVNIGPTRGTADLDLLATNFNDQLHQADNTSPLVSEEDSAFDHNFLYYQYRLKPCHNFKWIRYSSRRPTDAVVESFRKKMQT